VSTCPLCTEVSSISVDVSSTGAELQPANTNENKIVAKPVLLNDVFIINSFELFVKKYY
jgi:hypothetical protein